MKRHISAFGLLCVSVSAILGSGWLFGAFYAAKEAGPASIISWVLGGALVCVIAFVFGEVCSLVPISGSSVRIPQITHGKVVGIFFALIIWISYVALMVVETQAVVQYVSYFYPFMVHAGGGLSLSGYSLAFVVMLILAAFNTYSVKWLISCNTFLTIIKIIVPVGLSLVFIWFFFSFEQVVHPAGSEFAPAGMHGILLAISSGGVIFSFNAFKQAAELAGEAKNPKFSVPFAIVGSILLCIVIFVLLQTGFLSVLNAANLKHGWEQLDLGNNNSPFASIIIQSKIMWLLPILFFAAIISPFAAGLMYCTGGARSLFGIAANGCAPKIFLKVNKRMIPFYSIWLNLIFGMVIFLFFKGWDAIATFLTCLFAFSYAVAPVCMIALRYQVPKMQRSMKLPFGLLWAYVAFYICTLFIYWTGWVTLYRIIYFLIFCLIVVFIFELLQKIKGKKSNLEWKSSIWMWPYFIGIMIFSYLGNFGGHEVLGTVSIMVLMAIFCAIILALAACFKSSPEKTEKEINEALAE